MNTKKTTVNASLVLVVMVNDCIHPHARSGELAGHKMTPKKKFPDLTIINEVLNANLHHSIDTEWSVRHTCNVCDLHINIDGPALEVILFFPPVLNIRRLWYKVSLASQA